MKTEVLAMLRGSDGYVSGQQICEKFGVSRTAVWKIINSLKDEGYVIEAAQNKGYRITGYPDILTKEEIASVIKLEGVKTFASDISFNETVDSTNNVAKKMAEDGAAHGTLVVAEQQTGGKGRRGRHWVSPSGTGIWMTYILRPDITPDRASMLTLVAAMATAEGIQKHISRVGSDAVCAIKWPNDIVLNSKKIVGILTEMSAEPDCVNYVVTGIGINVNMTEFEEDIKENATSILKETGCRMRRSEIIGTITKKFEEYYETFIKTADLSALADSYNSILINKGRQVRISASGGEEETGTAVGIDDRGGLLITRDDGTVRSVIAGEVSVRGLYGYV